MSLYKQDGEKDGEDKDNNDGQEEDGVGLQHLHWIVAVVVMDLALLMGTKQLEPLVVLDHHCFFTC